MLAASGISCLVASSPVRVDVEVCSDRVCEEEPREQAAAQWQLHFSTSTRSSRCTLELCITTGNLQVPHPVTHAYAHQVLWLFGSGEGSQKGRSTAGQSGQMRECIRDQRQIGRARAAISRSLSPQRCRIHLLLAIVSTCYFFLDNIFLAVASRPFCIMISITNLRISPGSTTLSRSPHNHLLRALTLTRQCSRSV